MSTLANLTLAPFAMILRMAQARPWLSIVISAAAGLVAYLLHHEMWMAGFVCFGAYLLMWLDEMEHPQPVEMGTGDNVE